MINMASAWQELVSKQLDVDRARHANNPGIQALSNILASVSQERSDVRREGRAEAAQSRVAARTAAYQRYPAAAAQEVGIDVPASTGGQPETPEGMALKQVTVGEDGVPSYQFGQELSESTLAKIYTDYVTEIRKGNQEMSNRMAFLQQEPQLIDIPTYDEWKQETFGVTQDAPQLNTISDDQLLDQFGYTEEEVQLTMQEEGVSRAEVMAFLRSQLGG